MILGKDINPDNNIYHVGAKIIAVIKSNDSDSLNVFNIFNLLNENEKISFNLFSLGLDWLFLLGVVEIANGQLKKCF